MCDTFDDWARACMCDYTQWDATISGCNDLRYNKYKTHMHYGGVQPTVHISPFSRLLLIGKTDFFTGTITWTHKITTENPASKAIRVFGLVFLIDMFAHTENSDQKYAGMPKQKIEKLRQEFSHLLPQENNKYL